MGLGIKETSSRLYTDKQSDGRGLSCSYVNGGGQTYLRDT